MKEPKNQKRGGETISLAALTKVRPVPFGDVRKYYLAAKVGTVVLLALCFHVSVAAIALRTDSCEQLSTALIIMMLLAAIAVIVGHYMRSLLGYGISAAAAFLLILLLQFGNGGAPVSLVSDLPEYGEVFRDGAKSTEFWILLAKVIAVVHLLLTVLFIRSTLTVTEEPPLKGMNVQIKRFTDWLDKNNNSLPPGRRATDYWFVAGSMFLYMLFVVYDTTMGQYDYYSLGCLTIGAVLIALRQTVPGAALFVASALIRCTMYQMRFGMIQPVIASYLGMCVAFLYLIIEVSGEHNNTSGRINPEWMGIISNVIGWIAVTLVVACVSVHEILNAYSGDYMGYQKDSLPLLIGIPLLSFLILRSRKWYGFLLGGVCYWWFWDTLNNATPLYGGDLFHFDSVEQHGTIAVKTTDRMMSLVKVLSVMSLVMMGICAILTVILGFAALKNMLKRRADHGREKD
ncbi:MAG: hypothetical protein J5845_07520 [Lachnospiraceae bacterium]|nr:hypothetical protein [Lachnospiraceae bacterium]